MANPYCSFLLRCWHLGSGAERVEIEHIHSGERTVVASFEAAVAWMRTRSDALTTEYEVVPDQPARTH